MSNPFEGKVALVTGGASGIGRVTALEFARSGAAVTVADVDDRGGAETARLIRDAGGKSLFEKVDVTKAEEVATMIDHLGRAFGRLDFAFNNAGTAGPRAPTAEYSLEAWEAVLAVNLTGVFLCMKHEIPLLLQSGAGVIVNMSSVAGVTGFPDHAGYTASKHGVIGLTRTAALEYAKTGLRINALCPAYTRTPMLERVVDGQPELAAKLAARVPAGRLGRPEEMAAAVLYLCSDAAAFITGQALIMDGGITAG